MKSGNDIESNNSFSKWLFAITIIVLLSSCNTNRNSGESVESDASINTITLASRIRIEKDSNSVILNIINPWQGAENVNFEYHLVKRGTILPSGIDSSSVIFVPVKKIICMSTTHIGMISALGEENTIKGVSGKDFIYSAYLNKKAAQGEVEDVGYEANLNKELILKINPDLIMMYGIGSESSGYVGKIKELGIKVLFNGDYLENDPVAKAEWIKLFGALYSKELLADSIFRSEKQKYDSIKTFISNNISIRPKVLLGLPYKDKWYISPGNSFISRLITDAGGEYIWHDTKSSVSMPYGIENVYIKALTADYWLNISAIKGKEEILAVDPRLKELPCYVKGNLFNNNNRLTLAGGNDYWEMGSVYPHIILEDIASILHPELFGKRKLVFYRKIE